MLDVTQDPSTWKEIQTVVACAGELAKRELCRIEITDVAVCSPYFRFYPCSLPVAAGTSRPANSGDQSHAFEKAAQEGDVTEVKQLLASGAARNAFSKGARADS